MIVYIDDQLINLDYVQFIIPSCGDKYEVGFEGGNVICVSCTKDEMLKLLSRIEESQ